MDNLKILSKVFSLFSKIIKKEVLKINKKDKVKTYLNKIVFINFKKGIIKVIFF